MNLDIAIISGAGYYIAGYLATDRGFLTQEGINGEWVVAGTPESIRAVVSGSVPVGLIGGDGSLIAVTKGAPIREIGASLVKPTYDVIGEKGMTGLADLKGKDVGVSSVASGTAVLARAFFRARGLQPGEYDLIVAGGNTERIAALQAGKVGAALLSDPGNFVSLEQGYTHLGNILEVIPDYDFSGWWANLPWAQQNPDVATRFLKAQIRAMRWLYDPANRDGVLAVLQERLKVSPTIVERSTRTTPARCPTRCRRTWPSTSAPPRRRSRRSASSATSSAPIRRRPRSTSRRIWHKRCRPSAPRGKVIAARPVARLLSGLRRAPSDHGARRALGRSRPIGKTAAASQIAIWKHPVAAHPFSTRRQPRGSRIMAYSERAETHRAPGHSAGAAERGGRRGAAGTSTLARRGPAMSRRLATTR